VSTNSGSQGKGDPIEELRSWLRSRGERDRVFAKGKKVEVVFLVETVNFALFRTEGVGDITLVKLPGTDLEVPVILPQKLQAVARRRMLSLLRAYRDANPDKLKGYLERLAKIAEIHRKRGGKEEKVYIGFAKAKQYASAPETWDCFIQPPGSESKNVTDVGMDGFCPACALFGTIEDQVKLEGIAAKGLSAGVKMRVEFDPAFAFIGKDTSTVKLTHIKVGDGVSWTGESLYQEEHVVPGTVFVGKATLEDVTEGELRAFLTVLSTIDRIGGRERLYGGVRIHLVGIRGGVYETVSALELARELAKKYKDPQPPTAEDVRKELKGLLNNKDFKEIDAEAFRQIVDNSKTLHDLLDTLWEDTVDYDVKVVERILETLGRPAAASKGGGEEEG